MVPLLICFDIGDKSHKEIRIVRSPNIECFKGHHPLLAYGLVIPVLGIFGLIIPLLKLIKFLFQTIKILYSKNSLAKPVYQEAKMI